MPHIQSQSEWEMEMSQKILDFIHHELYLELRYFQLALSALKPKQNSSLQTFATDGIYLYYPAGRTIQIFQKNQLFLNRAFLHSVLHCIFSHLWISGNRDRQIWGLACDIAVEYTIDQMDLMCTKRILTWQRQQIYEQLAACKNTFSAAVIYRGLLALPKDQLALLQKEFYTDDHYCWPAHTQRDPIQQAAKNQWEKLARQTQIQQEQFGKDAKEAGRLFSSQIKADKSRRSYREFLNKFTILQEELRCDPEEFDLNYYIYGLNLYHNMPLIEPLETREIHKIREFVIVVDTSDSTSGELVQNFLKETFQILSHREQFFSKFQIRLLQCDDQVRMDQRIENFDQLEHFLDRFTLIGGGGTDFRPAFSYVNKLVDQNVFRHLGGLLYFTDGRGIYPKKRPPYPTAFLFLDTYDESAVPPWAMRLQLEPEEFMDRKQCKQERKGRNHYEYQTGETRD